MGEVVAAMATAHAPQLMTFPPGEDPAQLDATIAAMRQLGTLLDETRPDVVIVLGSDHLETFSLTCVPTFSLVAGPRARASFAGRDYDLPVHQGVADHLLASLVDAEFDMAYSADAQLGHAFAVPFEFVLGGRDIPVVPMLTNIYLPPLPSPRRAAKLGQQIARVVAERPERVAVVASGGMSHYPGTWKYSHPEFDFDRWLLTELERGNTEALLGMSVEQLDEVGNTELLTWATLLGIVGAQPAELVAYTPTWHHGHAMVRFVPNSGKPKPDAEQLARYEFRNSGFEFYQHPPASAYHLNRLLFDVRHDAGLRRSLLTDIDGVAARYELRAEERDAARTIPDVVHAELVSDHAEALVKAGAHPIQALMSLLAVYADYKAMRDDEVQSGE